MSEFPAVAKPPKISNLSEEGSEPSPVRSKNIRGRHKRTPSIEDDQPLIDTTARLTLHSKKTARKNKKRSSRPEKSGLLTLPLEILCDIIAYLRPTAVAHLKQTNHEIRSIIVQNQSYLVNSIVARRYAVLARCLPVPRMLKDVDAQYHGLLTSADHQKLLVIHKKPYQHIATPDHLVTCSCITCVLAWNNLCLVVDLARWQDHLDRREPIPQFARGAALKEQWNLDVLQRQRELVLAACQSSLIYAHLLDMHLQTTVRTLRRPIKAGQPRPYDTTEADFKAENDTFLERRGPSSYEFPYARDIYYGLEAYVPNRRWSRQESRWLYPLDNQHQSDLDWIKKRAEYRASINSSSLG